MNNIFYLGVPAENLRSGAKKIIEENGSRRFDMLKQVYGLQNDFYTALTGATDLSTKPLLEKPEKVRGTVASSNPFRKQIRVPKSVFKNTQETRSNRTNYSFRYV